MELNTTKQVVKAAIDMNVKYEDNHLKEAALTGFSIIKAYSHFGMIENESIKANFDIITKEEFYHHVVKVANWCVERYTK